MTPDGARPSPAAPAASPEVHRSPRRRQTFVLAALASAVAVLVGVLIFSNRSKPSNPYGLRDCRTVGALRADLANEPDTDQLRRRLVAVYEGTADKAVGCPSGLAYRWQSLVVQEMMRDHVPNGAVIISPNGVDLYFNRAAWGSYHQIGGKTGDLAQTEGGLPVRILNYPDGHVEIELSAGTVLVAEREDAPYFWIPAAYVSWWRSHPELGLPTSNPLPTSLHQEFQHGVAAITPAQPTAPSLTIVEHPGGELPASQVIRGHFLTQADGTAWFVDTKGRRAWVPDGGTWSCLHGDAKRVVGDLPSYAIAFLPFAGEAECPL